LYLIQHGGLEVYMIQTPEDLENTSVTTIILLTFGYERLKMGVDQIRLVPISRTPVGVISQVPNATANQRREIQEIKQFPQSGTPVFGGAQGEGT